MKTPRLLLLLSLAIMPATGASAQVGQPTTSLVNAGQTSLPAGQYVITNITTGQALYGVVGTTGQLLVQDPRVLQISVQAAQPSVLSPQAVQQTQETQGQTQQQGSMWGGLLKQGINSFVKQQMAPKPAGP